MSGRWADSSGSQDVATIAQEGCDIKATHESPGHWSRADGFFFDRWNVRVDFEYGNGYNDTLTGHLNGCDRHHCPAGSTIAWSSSALWTKR